MTHRPLQGHNLHSLLRTLRELQGWLLPKVTNTNVAARMSGPGLVILIAALPGSPSPRPRPVDPLPGPEIWCARGVIEMMPNYLFSRIFFLNGQPCWGVLLSIEKEIEAAPPIYPRPSKRFARAALALRLGHRPVSNE